MANKKAQAGDSSQPKRPKPESQAKKPAPSKAKKSTSKQSVEKPTAKPKQTAPTEEEHMTERTAKPKSEHPGTPARAGTRRVNATRTLTPQKIMVVAGLVVAAFFSAYSFAASRASAQDGGAGSGNLLAAAGAGAVSDGGDATAGGGGGCCGGGGAPVEAATTVEGDVQKIAVDTSTGSFNPNVIKAKAGVPIEIDFSQSPGGCLSGVMFPDFGISEDLTGGPKTVKVPALEKGEYTFYCQMQMVSAKIVVE